MSTINGVSDGHAKAAATAAREAWAATQAELDNAHADAQDGIDTGSITDRAAHQTVPADREDQAEVNARILANTLHAVAAPVSGMPLSATNEQVKEIENAQRRVTAIVESFYTGVGRKFLPLLFLEPADDEIRRMVDRAVEAYDLRFSNWIEGEGEHKFRSGDIVIIASSRPYERWLCNRYGPDDYGNMPHYVGSTVEFIDHLVSDDVHCDLDIYKHTELECR